MIGILTYHFAHNYGAMLQAFALKQFLSSSGFDAEIINYCPEKMKVQYSIGKDTINHRNFWWKTRNNTRRRKQYSLFEQFRIKMLTTHEEIKSEKLHEYSKGFDTIIVGSDQVWNTNINFHDPNYFLEFADQKTKKLGYSVSLGTIKMSKEMRRLVDQNIGKFSRVSFREKSAVSFLNEVYKRRYPVTCDPVFLLNSDDWIKIAEKPKSKIPDKYILYYSLQNDENLKSAVMKTAQMKKLPIVSIHPLCKKEAVADLNLIDVGPKEFLWLINNAEYIASNSFHATAFSIIFGKKAIIRPHPVLGDRNKDLLKLVESDVQIRMGDIYQFEKANFKILNELVAYSKRFLTEEKGDEFKPERTDRQAHPIILGAKVKDFDKHISCQSGGAATIISEYFINAGAVVYGCGFDEQLNVIYHRITRMEDLPLLRGSKYVRATLGNTFRDIVSDLKDNKKVLFIGNACNIAGLQSLVESLPERDNLYTVDFVCHGTPSHELYREYLDWVEKRENKKIVSFKFRYKDILGDINTRGKNSI